MCNPTVRFHFNNVLTRVTNPRPQGRIMWPATIF